MVRRASPPAFPKTLREGQLRSEDFGNVTSNRPQDKGVGYCLSVGWSHTQADQERSREEGGQKLAGLQGMSDGHLFRSGRKK